jgi:hypothetical protein
MTKLYCKLLFLIALITSGCNNFEGISKYTLTPSDPSGSFLSSIDMNIKLTLTLLDDEVLREERPISIYLVLNNNSKEDIYISLENDVEISAISGSKFFSIKETESIKSYPDVILPGEFLLFSISPEIPFDLNPDSILVVVWGSTEKDAERNEIGAYLTIPYED